MVMRLSVLAKIIRLRVSRELYLVLDLPHFSLHFAEAIDIRQTDLLFISAQISLEFMLVN